MYMRKTKQKFAWIPKLVWNMKTKHYKYTWIWFCWYWEKNYDSDARFFSLVEKDNVLMLHHRLTRINNYW